MIQFPISFSKNYSSSIIQFSFEQIVDLVCWIWSTRCQFHKHRYSSRLHSFSSYGKCPCFVVPFFLAEFIWMWNDIRNLERRKCVRFFSLKFDPPHPPFLNLRTPAPSLKIFTDKNLAYLLKVMGNTVIVEDRSFSTEAHRFLPEKKKRT